MGKGAYIKGARNERSLKKLLEERGFFVVRASKSGVDGVSPDLIALHATRKFALECKAHNSSALYIDRPKLRIYEEWQGRTGVPVFIAWKINFQPWRFFPLAALRETPQAYALYQTDLPSGLTLDDVVGQKTTTRVASPA